MEYYSNRLCISARELIDNGIVSQSCYQNWTLRSKVDVVRRGGGEGVYALVAVDSLPSAAKAKVVELFPNGDALRLKNWILSNYTLDQGAVAFFHDREKTGLDLPEDKAKEYIVNASVLNTCIKLYEHAKDCQRLFGAKYNWDRMATVIETLREELGHTLPASTLRFRKKVSEYKKAGYICLISGKFGNQNTRVVDYRITQLVLSIAALPNKPFNTNVYEMYLEFVCGELDVYDYETGELYDPNDFTDKNGEPKRLSESTIRNILNKPENKLKLEYALLSNTAFYHEQMPHMHRHGGQFSLSQITMDDVDLTRKLKDTKLRVHAYYAYDVTSGCRIGLAYGRGKDDDLVVECFRDMFRFIERGGWGIPACVEVENHLMSKYRNGFLKAGTVFPFVHFCAPENSQEKYAEPINGAVKKAVNHRNHAGIGRFYGKGKWRMESKKVSDANNDTYEDPAYYTFEELVADDRADSNEWNNRLHHNQKKYPGMTRMQVFLANINPTLRPYDKLTLSKYIGERVETKIRRNSTVRVAYEDWWLSGPEILEKLQPNDYKVTAYYIPEEDGSAKDVYLFQGDRFIDKVEKVVTYNRNYAEQTDEDVATFIEQQKRVSHFSKYLRDNAITRVGKQRKTIGEPEEPEIVETVELPSREMPDEEWVPDTDARRSALEDY